MSNGQDDPTKPRNQVRRAVDSAFAPDEEFYGRMLQGLREQLPQEEEPKRSILPRGYRSPMALPGLILGEMVGGWTGKQEALGLVTEPGTIDLTDPGVDPGDAQLNPLEDFLRNVRRFSRQFGAATPAIAGVEQAQEEGKLIPPKNFKEGAIDIVSGLLAGIAPWLAAGPVAGATGLGVEGALATNVPRAIGRAIPGVSRLGKAAEPLGLVKAGAVEEAVGGALSFDAAVGAGYGAGEAALERMLGHDSDIGAAARNYALYGVGLGLLFRAKTVVNTARSIGRIATGAQEGLGITQGIAPDVVVDGIKSGLANGRLTFRNAKGEFVKRDDITPEQFRKFQLASVDKAQGMVEGSVPLVEQAAEQATPAAPATLPPDLQTPAALSEINLIAAKYYMDQAATKVHRLSPEELQAELLETKKFLFQPEFPESARKTAAARIMALEKEAGESLGTPSGVLPLEQEVEALTFVLRELPRQGERGVLQQAGRFAHEGRPEVAARIRELVEKSKTGTGDLVTAYHNSVQDHLDRVSSQRRRGFKKDSRAILNGRPVRLTKDPYLGLVHVETLDGKREILLAETEKLLAWPRSGKTVRLKNGEIVVANAASVERGMFLVRGSKGERWERFDMIDEVGSARSVQRQHQHEQIQKEREIPKEDVQPLPPTAAVTSAGEPVTVTGIGSQAAEVVTKTGQRKTIKRSEVKRSAKTPQEITPVETAQAGAAAPTRFPAQEVTDFVPGKVPNEGNRQLFFQVQTGQQEALEQSLRTGDAGPSALVLRQKGKAFVASVLPPEPADELALYAIELPAEAGGKWKRSPNARAALGALETGKLKDYASPVEIPVEALGSARVYRVSGDLHRAVQRPSPILEQMSPDEVKGYLRNLLAFNDEVQSELAAPAKKIKRGKGKVAKGVEEKSAAQVFAGEAESSEGIIEALEAKEELGREVSDVMQARIISEANHLDPQAGARSAFEKKGLTPETEAFWASNLEELVPSPEGFNTDVMLAVSTQEQGQRMFVLKRQRPGIAVEGGNVTPTTENYFELRPVDAENIPLREGVREARTPQEVVDILLDQGYEPTLKRLFGAEYVHTSKPSLVAHIKVLPEAGKTGAPGVEAEVVQHKIRLGGKAEEVTPPKVTKKTQDLVAILAEQHDNVVTGTPEFDELASARFTNSIEAHEWLEKKGFRVSRDAMENKSLPARFSRLPSLDRLKAPQVEAEQVSPETANAFKLALEAQRKATLRNDALLSDLRFAQKTRSELIEVKASSSDVALADAAIRDIIESMRRMQPLNNQIRENLNRSRVPIDNAELREVEMELGAILHAYQQAGPIPDAVADYAVNFSHTYYERLKRGPFNKTLRLAVNAPTIDDLGPSSFPQVLGRLADEGMAAQEGIPAEVAVLKGFRIGTDQDGMKRSAQTLRNVLENELPRASELETIRANLLDELDTVGQLLDKPVLTIAESEQAYERLKQLRKRTLAAGRSVTHEMRAKEGVHVNPPDFGPGGRVFYQNILGGSTRVEAKGARHAKEIVDARNTQTLWAESAAKLDDIIPVPSRFDPKAIDLARYTKTGQVVQVIGGTLEKLTGPEVTVRFIGTGEEMTVARELVERGKNAAKDEFDAALSHWVAEGRFADVKPFRPPFGYGPLEQRLGLLGTDSRVAVGQALQKRSDELAATLRLNKDGTFSARSKPALDELMTNYRDALWLDLVEKVEEVPVEVEGLIRPKFVEGVTIRTTPVGEASIRATERKGKTYIEKTVNIAGKVVGLKPTEEDKLSNVILGAINRRTNFSGKMEKAFKRAAYDRMKQAWGDHPFAELQARAFSGYLEPHQEAIIRGWMDEIGLSPNMPLARAAIELQRRQLLDPHTARIAIQLNKEMGYELRLGSILGGIPASKNKLIFRPVGHPGDLHFGGLLGIPWKIAARHPTTRLAMDYLYRARDQEMRSVQRVRVLTQELQQLGLMKKERNLLRGLIFEARENELVGWDELKNSALLKGKTPEEISRFETGHRLTTEFLNDRLESHIRHFLRRRITPVEFTAEDLELQKGLAKKALASELYVDPASIGQGAVVLHSHPDMVIHDKSLRGLEELGPKWTEDQIDVFMKMRRDFRSSLELPAEAPPGVKEEVYEEMKDVFDFWKRYGVHNYWPLIHEGNLAVIVERDGKEVIMGWAGTFPDAVTAARYLRKTNRVGPHEGMKIVENAQVADDLMIKASPTNREFQAMQKFFAEQVNLGPDEVNVLIERVKKPLPPNMVRPGNVHVKPRVAELAPIFEDFDKEIALYNARTARMEYRWDVRKAYKTLYDVKLDKALSQSYGAPSLHGGRDGLPNLLAYMEDRFSIAIGERTSWERMADGLWMFINMAHEAPKDFARVINGEIDFHAVINPGTYYKKYAARARASELLKIQSLIRLGLSPATAVANFTQRWVSTFPKLIDERTSPDQAAKLMWDAQGEGRKIWRAWKSGKRPTGELGAMYEIIESSGIDLAVMKQLAGGGRSMADTFGRPLDLGKGPVERGFEWADYYIMYMFNGTEKVNRYSTAIAAVKKYAGQRGKSVSALTSYERAEAGEAARSLVRDTQFWYDELSMPRALSWFGPIGRILFQFKPFMLNMFGFQKDLLVNLVMKRDKVAIEQMGTHLGALFALGGVTGLLYSPYLSLPAEVFRSLPGFDFIDPGTRVQSWLKNRREEMALPEENFVNSQVFRADDLLYYGLPGLIGLIPGVSGLSMGERIGISGQDVMLSVDAPGFLGPHASVYLDMMKAWNEYRKQRGTGPGLIGAAAGGLAMSFAPRAARQALPYATSTSALIGAMLGGIFGGTEALAPTSPSVAEIPEGPLTNLLGVGGDAIPTPVDLQEPFRGFFTESASGRRYLSRLFPTAVRNSGRTLDLFLGGAMRDLDGKPMYVPAGERGEEAFLALAGLPTIRREEYQAAAQFMLAEDADITLSRQTYVERIARALVRGTDRDHEVVYETYDEALKNGIEITQEMVDREIESLTTERMETIRKRVGVGVR